MLSLTIPQVQAIFDTLYDRPIMTIDPWVADDEPSMLEYVQLVTDVQTQLMVGGLTNATKLKLIKRFGCLPDDVIVGGSSIWQTQ